MEQRPHEEMGRVNNEVEQREQDVCGFEAGQGWEVSLVEQ